MKAIIPVAGTGTRLRPHTYTQPKPLLPVAGKPIINFIIDDLLAAGIHDFVFVIGYLGEKIRNYIEEVYPDLSVEFVTQEERQGLGHAVWTAREPILRDGGEILIVLGDTIFDMYLPDLLHRKGNCLGVKEVKEPREFGVVELDTQGTIRKVIEKPRIPKSNLALVGLYKIADTEALVNAIEYNMENNIRTMGEFQLADGLMRMIETGVQMSTIAVNNWFDCGKRDILLETNARLLDKAMYSSEDLPPFENSIIVHPVSIGVGCRLVNCIVGPYVTIGKNTKIEHSIVRNSIIGSYASLRDVVLTESVIGSDTSVAGPRQSLNLGDNTEIDFS